MDHMGNSQVFEGYYEFSRFFSPHWNKQPNTSSTIPGPESGRTGGQIEAVFQKGLGAKSSLEAFIPMKGIPPLFVFLVKFED